MSILDSLKPNVLVEGKKEENFIGRPFYIDYEKVNILISDAWKHKVKGIPQSSFLLAYYDGEDGVEEALLLRALAPVKLPTDNDVVSSMIEYYKDNLDTSGRAGATKPSKLDDFTRYEFSFSGLECRILGVFYKTNGKIEFGADLENFYSANNYRVYKATGKALQEIVNQRTGDDIAGNDNEFKIGKVRYSSSRRFQNQENDEIPVYVSPKDFIGKRTALFGMTRTGKSNTIKKIIEASVEISNKAENKILSNESLLKNDSVDVESNLEVFAKNGAPKFPIGQIIFDINGEYANANMQDKGTAIFELYEDDVVRYSVLEKQGFEIMKINFYKEVETGFSLISNYFKNKKESSDYVNNFLAVSLEKPDDYDTDRGVKIRYDRKLAAYLCCLRCAGFKLPHEFKVSFQGAKEINALVREDNPIDPSKNISLDDAVIWFTRVWENYKEWDYLKDYPKKKGKEWADEELQAMLGFLTRHKVPGSNNLVSGYLKLKTNALLSLHTSQSDKPFEDRIIHEVRSGKIVIIDLSQGDKDIQTLYSERICQKIFSNAMNRFINVQPNNFIQFYFEEAHNLFPKKDDKDLSQIYNRIAKEGAKLNLGMIYATQEVSSISSNILKNTQNWFIAHLNNEDETKELKKYYDFEDFTSSLIRFSANNDKGFVRMKTYTNPFVVPVQIDQFLATLSN